MILKKGCGSSCDYTDKLISYMHGFLKEQLECYRHEGFLHCLSGGVDSATMLKLVVDSVGAQKIRCIITNIDGFNNPDDISDAVELCERLNVTYDLIDISSICKSYTETVPELKSQPTDNIASRVRLGIASEFSLKYNLRLLFAGPYSDFIIRGGDLIGSAIAHCYPFYALFKADVYAIAERIGLDDRFLKKIPSNSGLENPKPGHNMGLKFSDIEKLAMFFEGLIEEEKISHIPKKKRAIFHLLYKLNQKDIDYPVTDLKVPLKFGRKEFFKKFESFPFERQKK